MATAYKIHITPDNTGLWGIRQNDQAAETAAVLLQKDMNNHHVFFNKDGFHDHISHHILALYGTGASVEDLRKAFVENEGYQRPALEPRKNLFEELRDWDKAKQRLGKEQYYADWLVFFEHEIERLGGWQKTLTEYMFKGGQAEPGHLTMRKGFLHPLIQLMYGIEWDQPAMVAMALAQACVHRDDMGRFLLGAEEQAQKSTMRTPMPRIADLLDTAAGNEKLRNSPRMSDGNKVRDGVLARAWDEAVACTGRVRVAPDELAERTAEMFDAAIYAASAAAVRPGKDPKYDFFLMHHVNSAPIFVTWNKQDWLATEHKVRMLEWKIRMDIVQYVARGSPKLSVEKIANYVPKDEASSAGQFLPRLHSLSDDGHVIKLWRAVGVGRKLSEPYEDRDWLRVKGTKLWDQINHLIVDSVEAPGPRWVRSAGFEEAWKDVQDTPKN
ncbi:HypA protein [Apiospora phragmitis]|uniref:HypA protein n=1 Tax=Apiospora phragmitis TaxID=2905665 RepID=A0ABR1T3R9_9PEZI